ncbi:Carbamoyltransferase HypF [Nocardia sp. RB56]|uniref:Carbamoyltransferase n=1 Tax=Nocardia aurantia TaxID=2585199 RepID=A0A7K0DKW7_9NOCA|nr:Carbamoyltransferase HypF [Nocardia aurantia]
MQGVGFRPFVYTSAAELSLTGEVRNDSCGVVIEIEGARSDVDAFVGRIRCGPPPLAVIEEIEESEIPIRGGTGFRIADTTHTGGGRTLASPDVAICADCVAELRDPGDRRYRHPFVNCTNCGPRFTIIAALPYDRRHTSMAGFPLCPQCAGEYADPADRRFHAQPIACHDCGPTLSYRGPGGGDPVTAARNLLRSGGILAVKGIGGYHLACDATDAAAVAELRRRKRRGDKPFAVMVPDLTTARAIVQVDAAAAAALTGPARPIVLLPRTVAAPRTGDPGRAKSPGVSAPALRPEGRCGGADAMRVSTTPPTGAPGIPADPPAAGPAAGTAEWLPAEARAGDVAEPVDGVAPGNPDLGVLIAYTPLHLLLFGLPGDEPGPRIVVMTSGNLGGEPLCYDDADALDRLADLADGFLWHDRRILVPCDDSVVRLVDGLEVPIRRSRGYAPMPLALPFPVPPTLAVGADLKNTCAVAEGRYAWLSQHIGDMDDLATLDAFTAAERHLEELTGVRPTQLAADAHPRYRSTSWAHEHAADRPVVPVQHHHAHVAAVMGEHGVDPETTVIGFAFDGTGFGSDGAIWGGEVLAVRYKGYRRAAHLRYVPLAGGDASVRRPYRMALAHLYAAGIDWDEGIASVRACPPAERRMLAQQLITGVGCVPTSSMGRLFDAVSSLAGVRHVADFEAQAAIELEGLSRATDPGAVRYHFAVHRGSDHGPGSGHGSNRLPPFESHRDGDCSDDPTAEIDPSPVLAAVVSDAARGVPVTVIGARFHEAVAQLILGLATEFATEGTSVALSGGVFQNTLLLTRTRKLLTDNGFRVLCHRRLPPNDGGVAFGQLLVAGAG